MKWWGILGLFGAAVGAVLWRFSDIFFSPHYFLPRDNLSIHFSMFQYVSAHVRYLSEFPDFLYAQGMALAPFANNHLLLLPYRFVGYALAAYTSLPVNSCYKVSVLVLGQGTFLLGVALVANQLFRSKGMALGAVMLSLVSGLSLSLFHEEQMLATLFFVPWVWLAVLSIPKNPNFILVAAALFGMSLNHHYPQILVVYYVVIGLLAVLTVPEFRLALLSLLSQKANLALAISVVLVSAAPLLFSFSQFNNKLISPFRDQQNGIKSESFSDYERLNRMGASSVAPKNLVLYSGWRGLSAPEPVGDMDEHALFMTFGVPIALVLLLFLRVRHRAFLLLSVFLLAVLSCGIHGPAPRLLWPVLPGITLFRQWYHFTPLLNLHFLFLILFAIQAVASRYPLNAQWLVRALMLLMFILNGGLWAIPAYRRVQQRLLTWQSAPPALPTSDAFANHIFFDYALTSPLATPKEIDYALIKRKGASHFPWWRFSDGSVYSVSKGQLAFVFSPGLISARLLQVPSGAASLVWLQHNDGNWRVKDQNGDAISTPRRSPFLLETPLRDGLVTFRLERIRSPWPLLITTSWIPLCYSILLLKKKKGWGLAPQPSKIITT